MNSEPKKVAVYARVSSDRQDVDLSISAQLRALREYAQRNNCYVVKEFIDEAESGRTSARPAFREMIAIAKTKGTPFETILVWKLNRFARSREDSIIFKSLLRKHGVQVISVNEPFEDTPSGRLLEGIIEVIDEFYSANLAQDVSRGMKENAMRGFFSGGLAPFGYRIQKVKDGIKFRSTLAIDESNAPIVQRIFNESLAGKGLKEITKSLNADGIRTLKGKKWSNTGIYAILRNEIYSGTLVWGRRSKINPVRVENAWPAIVTKETFQKVQSVLKERSPMAVRPRRVTSDYLLSGLLKCEVCGRPLSGHSAKSGKFLYYRCINASKRGAAECPGHWIPKAKIENFVIDRVRNNILTDDNLADLVHLTREEFDFELKSEKDRLTIIDRQMVEVDSKLDRLYDALENGSFSSEELAPRIKKLLKTKDELQANRSEIDIKLQSKLAELPSQDVIQDYVADLRSLLESSPIIEQKAFLRTFIRDITIGSRKMKVRYTLPLPPENFEEEKVGVLPFIRHGEPWRTVPELMFENKGAIPAIQQLLCSQQIS